MTREIVLAGVWMLGSVALSAADAPAAFNWKTVLPTVQRVVRHTFLKESANAHYLPAIVETADVTGAGRQEALVDLGSGGYTADMTVMVLEGDTPVLAKF